MVRVAGDGNCLFRSISVALHNCQDKHKELRKQALDYLQENKQEYEWIFGSQQEMNGYIRRMS
jgi:hypothetical protein